MNTHKKFCKANFFFLKPIFYNGIQKTLFLLSARKKKFGNNYELSRETQFRQTVYLDAKKDITKNIYFTIMWKFKHLFHLWVPLKIHVKKQQTFEDNSSEIRIFSAEFPDSKNWLKTCSYSNNDLKLKQK